MKTKRVRVCLLVAILGAHGACGGGGSSGAGDVSRRATAGQGSTSPPGVGVPFVCAPPANTPGSNPGGIEGTGRGPARRDAGLRVAGQTWDMGHASIVIDGQPATSDQVVDGLITTVRGTIAPSAMGTADSVVSETWVAGPITHSAGDQLVVLGQTVALTPDTLVDGATPAVTTGDTVAINALATANGSLIATRIARRSADLEYVVTGRVSVLDGSRHSFQINGLTVDYSGVAPQGFPNGVVHDGDLVRVYGRLTGGSTTLSARDVEFRLATFGQAGDFIALYGYITRFASNTDFDVNGVPITTSAATDMSGATDTNGQLVLALNEVVDICGTLLSNGEVGATQVFITWDY